MAIALISALTGWALAQFSGLIKNWLHRRKVIKLLKEEIKDIEVEATRLLYFHARNLQKHGAYVVGDTAAVSISNPIFKNYYKDAVLGLNQSQRISFQMIHNQVENQNQLLIDYKQLNSALRKEYEANGPSKEFRAGARRLGAIADHGYGNCKLIIWHVKHHLSNHKSPDLHPKTEAHAAYQAYRDEVRKEINEFVESGKKLESEAFSGDMEAEP
ncbi:hypothetical protein [Thermomonas sp. HDW16]|uniref:hypothetical protein n=1 Tax=Thermomonas sp. HDW16 TaxID=2714945 RepID=UPI0014093D21|nr:hypothetical protein [Thermomonas sp. HDW16]QIL21072.1 hypothetical protein G7079_10225 [Thermomonas sp. HDW16]